MTTLIEKIVGDLGDKRRWRAYSARVTALPAGHRTTVEALERLSGIERAEAQDGRSGS